MVADTFGVAHREGISLSHKGFDTSVGLRVEAKLADLLSRLTEEVAVPPEVATTAVAAAAVAPAVVKARKVAEQRVVVQGVPVSVPAAARPGSRRLGFAITPARPLTARRFAGGRNWFDTQKTEE